MDRWQFVAASSTVVLHGAMIAAALALVGPQVIRAPVRPIEVALIRPPEPPPAARVETPKPPAPLPIRTAPPRAAPKPAAPVAIVPEPPPPAVVATPVDEARPSAITAPAAPVAAPVAPQVAEGVPAAQPTAVAASTTAATSTRRVGPRLDASWSGNAPPPYPAMARRMGEEGEVRLDIHVGPDGGVLEVRLKKSSGSQLLDQTATETVKKWRFSPATVNGNPVAEWYYNWKWVFRLES